MDAGVAAFLILFGAASMTFGLWLRPKWQRARKKRIADDAGLLLSPERAREWWLWINAWGSMSLGVILFCVVGANSLGRYIEGVREAEARARVAELHRYVAGCSRETLTLQNRGSSPRRIKVEKLALVERAAALMAGDERWNATLHDSSEAVLDPGQSATLRFDSTPGVCGRILAGQIVLTVPLTTPHRCDLEFDLDVGELHDRVACKIQ